MEFAFTFENLLKTNLINFIIVLSILTLIFKKARLGELIDKMALDIQDKVEVTSQDVEKAQQEYEATRESVREVPQIQERILENAQRSADGLRKKIEQKANQREKEIECKVEAYLKSQKEKSRKVTIKEVYLACVDLAQEEILKRLDAKMHKKLINNSIEELENIKGHLS